MKLVRASTAYLLILFGVASAACTIDATAAEGEAVTTPNWPSALAPFAQLLQTNRGTATPIRITDMAGRSNAEAAAVVYDIDGFYQASLTSITRGGRTMLRLIQTEWGDQWTSEHHTTRWLIDPQTNGVISKRSMTDAQAPAFMGFGQGGSPPATPAEFFGRIVGVQAAGSVPLDWCLVNTSHPTVEYHSQWDLEGWTGCHLRRADELGRRYVDRAGGLGLQVAQIEQMNVQGGELDLSVDSVEPCLNHKTKNTFRTRSNVIGETPAGLIGTNLNFSLDHDQWCQDGSLFSN
jgi:hypothetical protein